MMAQLINVTLPRGMPARVSFAQVAINRNPRAMRLAMSSRNIVAAAQPETSTVKIVVQGRNVPVTPAIKEYAESKVQKATHNFESAIKEVDVRLSVRGSNSSAAHHQRDQIVEVTVYTLRHGVIRVEDTEDDLYAAMDLVTDKLKRKMRQMKEKAIQRNTWPGRGGTKGGDHIEDHLEDGDVDLKTDGVAQPVPEIVREKVLFLEHSMTSEEAIEQLEAVGHDFFVFLDSSDKSMKIVYRRRSHGYGVIIPQAQ